MLWLGSCPLIAQEIHKKLLKEEDYHLWGNLSLKDISPDGKWISYKISHESGADTLFVMNTTNQKKIAFTKIRYSGFYTSHRYASLTTDGLEILNLKSGNDIFIPNVVSFDFSSDGRYLLFLDKDEMLTIKKLDDELILLMMPHVKEFKMNPLKDKFAYVQNVDSKSKVGIIKINNNFKVIEKVISENGSSFCNIIWEDSGKAIAFYDELDKKDNDLLFYNIEKDILYHFNHKLFPEFSKEGMKVSKISYKVFISPDLEKVFFPIESNNQSKNFVQTDSVQIWYGDDPYTYPQQRLWNTATLMKTAVWYPEKNKFLQITNEEFPNNFLTGDANYAIIFNPKQYEPQYEYFGPMDFYILNLQTNETDLFLKKHSGYLPHTLPSPTGKYIAYFRSGNWWVYNFRNKEHKNLTKSLNVRLENDINESNGEIQAYGIAGWIDNDNSIIIYDQFDIWKVNTESGECKRLTNGREKNIRFRVTNFDNNVFPLVNFDGRMGKTLNLEKGMIIKAQGLDASSGYYLWTNKLGLQEIINKQSKIDQLLSANNVIVYREQSFDLPPRIIKRLTKQNENILFQSNQHQENYYWGKAEPISYKISNGTILNGILYYPAGFNPEKKYPMIVRIYEKQFENLHSYILPEKYPSTGFNITNFTSDGYFVFLPDIEYEIGKVGMSAVECVTSAVNKVKEFEYISDDKIGLIGHSFGGYETNFIITQTDLFAAAVSSAGVADLVSFYLNLNWVTGKPDIWRFKNQIWRMDKSLFEDRNAYYVNSPISFVENIKTPLLSWTGEEDYQVNWHQSISWYLALRKLNKNHTLIIYPTESHVLLKNENQGDLSKRIKDWFEYYLKEKPPANWIKEKN